MRSDRYNETDKKSLELVEEKQEVKKESNTKKDKKKKKEIKFNTKKIIIIVLLVFAILFIYSRFICPSFIKINEYKIESELLDENFNGFKIVHISDIHYGTNINEKELKNIVKKINELKPDIVVFTGDLIDKDIKIEDEDIEKIKDALKDINPKHYKYAIAGDEDGDSYYDILDDANFILLDNKEKLIFNNTETPIVIAGFTDDDYEILDNEEYNNFYKIALIHKPDAAASITNANLILAGHNLGGIIKIGNPLFKFKGAKKYYKEHYTFEDKELFISYGLGTNKLNIRFNNKPSINLYRLYKK